MGLISLLVFVVLVVCVAYVGIWFLGTLAPGHPVILDNLIWVLAVLIILWTVWTALGGHDVAIPRVFGR